jgi:hypothetical protein
LKTLHTFEIVFLSLPSGPTREILFAARLQRPHFLTAICASFSARQPRYLFTLVSADPQARFQGDKERQVLWGRKPPLPELNDLALFENLDGVLIDAAASAPEIAAWQDRIGREAAETHHISFTEAGLQRRWLLLASPDEYAEKVMSWEAGASHDPR